MIKSVVVVGALATLTACGGTSIPMNDVINSGNPVIASGGGGGGGATPGTTNNDQSFKTILNNVRIGNGKNAVTYDSRLDAAAQAHADDMVANGYFAHDADGNDSDGTNTNMVGDRVTAQGYDWIAVGENLGGGQQSEAQVLSDWQGSTAHNDMMNAGTLEEFGIAVAGTGNGTRWVLVMATEG